MQNPILQLLNSQQNNSMVSRMSEIKQLISGQPVPVLYNRMLQQNPQFAQFVQQNQGKSVEQIAQEYGVDPAELQNLLR